MLYDELRNPKSVDELAAAVRDPQTGIEVYAASLLAIDETRPDGAAYLTKLAVHLGLPPALVESVHLRAKDAAIASAA